jgi:hypothetical protein
MSQCDNAKKPSWQVDSFRKYVGYPTAFVKQAGWQPLGLGWSIAKHRLDLNPARASTNFVDSDAHIGNM